MDPPDCISKLSVDPTFFKDVNYSISGIISPSFLKLLEKGGAKQKSYAGVGTTHFFAGEGADNLKLDEANEVFEIPIVKPLWIGLCASRKKIIPLDGFERGASKIFSSVCLTSTKIRQKDKTSIWCMVVYHNGKYVQKLTKACTHLIAIDSIPSPKYQIAKKLGLKVVTPDWIYDSVMKESLQDEALYDPELLIKPQAEDLNEEFMVKVDIRHPGKSIVAGALGSISEIVNKGATEVLRPSAPNILQNQLMSQPTITRPSVPSSLNSSIRPVQINSMIIQQGQQQVPGQIPNQVMQQQVLNPSMQQQLQNQKSVQVQGQPFMAGGQPVRITHVISEPMTPAEAQRFIQWQNVSKQYPQNPQSSQNTTQAQQNQLPQTQSIQQSMQGQQQLQSQGTLQQMQPLPGHPVHPNQPTPQQQQQQLRQNQNSQQQLQQIQGGQGHMVQNPPSQLQNVQLVQHSNPQQMQTQNTQQIQGQMQHQMQQQVHQQLQSQASHQLQGQGPQQMPGHVSQQLQGPVQQQIQSQVLQQMQSQGQIQKQMQGQVQQQLQGQGSQQMPGQVSQQLQGQVQQQLQGQVQQQLQGQGTQQMPGQVSQQLQGQVQQQLQGQVQQQLQGQVQQQLQMPGQVQSQGPKHIPGQVQQQLQGQMQQQLPGPGQVHMQQLQGQGQQQMQNQQQLQGQIQQQQLQNPIPQQNQQHQFQQQPMQYQSQNIQQLQFQNQAQMRPQLPPRQFSQVQVQQPHQVRVALPVSSQNQQGQQQIHFQVVQQSSSSNRPQMLMNPVLQRGQFQQQQQIPINGPNTTNVQVNQQAVYRQQSPNQIQFHPIQQHRMQSPDMQQLSGGQVQQNTNQLQQNHMNQGHVQQIPGHYNVVINQQFSPNSPNVQQHNNPQMAQIQHPQTGQMQTVQYQTQRPQWTNQHSEIIRQAQSDPDFKVKWNSMDNQQRMLFLQQLMQTQKNESMRQEMMQRQQQINQQSTSNSQQPVVVGQTQQRPMLNNQQNLLGSPNQNIGMQQNPMSGHQTIQGHPDGKHLSPIPSQNMSSPGPVSAGQPGQQTQMPVGSQGSMILQGHQVAQKTSPGLLPNQVLVQGSQGLPQQTQQTMSTQASPGSHQQKFLPLNQMPTRMTSHGFIGSPQPPQGSGVVRTQQIFTPQVGQQQQRVNVRHVLVHQAGQPTRPQVVLQQQANNQKLTIMSPQQQGHIVQQQTNTQWSPTQLQRMTSPGKPAQFQNRLQSPEQPTGQQQHSWNVRPQPQAPQSPSGSQSTMSYVQVVNSKTKTALANLLSNRLQGSAVPEPNVVSTNITTLSTTSTTPTMCPPPPPPVTSQSLSQSAPVTTPTNILIQRRTLANITNGSKPIQVSSFGVPRAPVAQVSTASAVSPSRPQFYGHDPQLSIPPEKFLMGCVFWEAESLDRSVDEWSPIVLQHGGDYSDEYSPAIVTHVLCQTQTFKEFPQVIRDGKRVVTLHWLSDIVLRKMLLPPYYAIHLPVPFRDTNITDESKDKSMQQPLKEHRFTSAGFSTDDRFRIYTMCKLLGAKYSPHFSNLNTALVASKAEGHKYVKAREWKKPVVTVQFLNEMLLGHFSSLQMIHSPKYQNFNVDQPFRFDIALAPHLMAAWKVPIRISNELNERLKAKRMAENDDERNLKKKAKIETDVELLSLEEIQALPHDVDSLDETEPSIWKPMVLITGFTRLSKEKMKEMIEKLGGKVTTDFKDATHLLLKKDFTTMKVFYAICRMRHIVDISWLYASQAAKRFVDEKAFIPTHEPFENMYKIKLSEVMEKPSRRTLFKDMTFHITQGITGVRRHDLFNLIECAGGTAELVRSWGIRETLSKFPKKNILITCESDFEMVEDHLRGARRPHVINAFTEIELWYWIASQTLTFRSDTNPSPKKSTITLCTTAPTSTITSLELSATPSSVPLIVTTTTTSKTESLSETTSSPLTTTSGSSLVAASSIFTRLRTSPFPFPNMLLGTSSFPTTLSTSSATASSTIAAFSAMSDFTSSQSVPCTTGSPTLSVNSSASSTTNTSTTASLIATVIHVSNSDQ